jgi:protein MAK11
MKDLLVVAGSYERLLYGLVSNISNQDDQLSASALEPDFIFPAHISCIKAVACNHRFLASGSTDELVKIYDLKLKKEIGNLLHHSGAVTCLQFFRKSHLITASEDGTISLIRTSDWEVLKTLTGHKYSVNSLDVHPSGKAMLSVGKEGTLKCWDLERGLCAYSMKLPAPAELVKWSDDGSKYAILMDRIVQVNQLEKGKTVGEITSSVRVNSILFTTFYNESVLLLGFENATIGIYSLDGNKILSWNTHDGSRVKSMDIYTDDYLQILVNISSNGKVNLWNLLSIKESQTPIVSFDTKSRLTSVMITSHLKCVKKETKVADEYVSELEEEPVKRQRIQVTMHDASLKKKSLKKKSLKKKSLKKK